MPRGCYNQVKSSEVIRELTQQPILQNRVDTLVMLVRKKRIHLAFAQTVPSIEVGLSLCGEKIGGEVFGVVDSADIPTLQYLAICPACLSEFMSKHRDRLLPRQVSNQSNQATIGSGVSRALANQIPLF